MTEVHECILGNSKSYSLVWSSLCAQFKCLITHSLSLTLSSFERKIKILHYIDPISVLRVDFLIYFGTLQIFHDLSLIPYGDTKELKTKRCDSTLKNMKNLKKIGGEGWKDKQNWTEESLHFMSINNDTNTHFAIDMKLENQAWSFKFLLLVHL